MKNLRESICYMCGADIVEAMGDWTINHAGNTYPVCGKCFTLTKIMEVIEDGDNRRSGLQIHH